LRKRLLPVALTGRGFSTVGGFTFIVYQLLVVFAVGAFTLVGSRIIWFVIKVTVGLRVEPDAETRGLDVSEMGMQAYATDSVA